MEVHKGWIRYTEKDDVNIGNLSMAQEKNRKDNDHSAIDQVREQLKGFMGQIQTCVKNGKKHFDGDFYIEILVCLNRIIPDNFKTVFAARRTCPTPFHDQIAYKFISATGDVQFLWAIPDIDTCERFRYHIETVDSDDKDVVDTVHDYYSGELARIEYFENNPEEKNNLITLT